MQTCLYSILSECDTGGLQLTTKLQRNDRSQSRRGTPKPFLLNRSE